MNGSGIMQLGVTLFEEMRFDGGQVVNASFADYKIPGLLDMPAVIDADGLNALVGHLGILKKIKAKVVLTPHPKEMARLLNVGLDQVQRNRKKVAKQFVLRYDNILVLKGHKTIVASKGRGIYINKTGNPGMATAGSGDVLTGIIAALLAQGLSAFEAAKYGVYIHGLAGDLAARDKTEICLMASDLIDYLPLAFKKVVMPM